jgi:hypothetical protein
MGFEVSHMQAEMMKAKATLLTAKGMIGLSIHIYEVVSTSGTISLLEVCKVFMSVVLVLLANPVACRFEGAKGILWNFTTPS